MLFFSASHPGTNIAATESGILCNVEGVHGCVFRKTCKTSSAYPKVALTRGVLLALLLLSCPAWWSGFVGADEGASELFSAEIANCGATKVPWIQVSQLSRQQKIRSTKILELVELIPRPMHGHGTTLSLLPKWVGCGPSSPEPKLDKSWFNRLWSHWFLPDCTYETHQKKRIHAKPRKPQGTPSFFTPVPWGLRSL